MHNKVKEALGSASYLTYHWRQYSFEQLEKEMVRVCGLCHKALGIPQDDSVTDFERGQWSVIQNIIGYAKDYSLAAQLCRETGIGYKKIKALQKDCGYSYKEEVNDFLKDSRNDETDYLKLEDQPMIIEDIINEKCVTFETEESMDNIQSAEYFKENILPNEVEITHDDGNYFEVSVNCKLYSCDVYGNGDFYHSIAEFKLLED